MSPPKPNCGTPIAAYVGSFVGKLRRRDRRIRLPVVVAVEPLERPVQPRPPVRPLELPVVGEALVDGHLHRVVVMNRLLEAGAESRNSTGVFSSGLVMKYATLLPARSGRGITR